LLVGDVLATQNAADRCCRGRWCPPAASAQGPQATRRLRVRGAARMARKQRIEAAETEIPSYRGTLLLVALLVSPFVSPLLLLLFGPTWLDAIGQVAPNPQQAPRSALITIGVAAGVVALLALLAPLGPSLAIRPLRLLVYTRRMHGATERFLVRQ